MSGWIRLVALGAMLTLIGLPAWAQQTELWDRYLDRPRGPYRAQVVDAESKVPLAGAVVVVLWRRDRVYPFHMATENYAVREAVTDTEGRFVLDASDVEEGAPRRARRPEFLIFFPGYGKYPGKQVSPKGFTGGVFEQPGTVVELPRLADREDRRKNLLSVDPHSYSDTPFKDLPELMRRVNEESGAVGISPYPQTEKQ